MIENGSCMVKCNFNKNHKYKYFTALPFKWAMCLPTHCKRTSHILETYELKYMMITLTLKGSAMFIIRVARYYDRLRGHWLLHTTPWNKTTSVNDEFCDTVWRNQQPPNSYVLDDICTIPLCTSLKESIIFRYQNKISVTSIAETWRWQWLK